MRLPDLSLRFPARGRHWPAPRIGYAQTRTKGTTVPNGGTPIVGAGPHCCPRDISAMITLRLPDGSTKQVPAGTRPRDIAEGIGKRLAQAAIAAKVDGAIVDLDRELPAGNGTLSFQILTDRDPEALDVLRHSCAHVMARAVMRLFPGVQLAFGPTIENGFYYDIDATPPIKEEDFQRIEEEMRRIVKEAEPFERFERPTGEARALCGDLGQSYK